MNKMIKRIYQVVPVILFLFAGLWGVDVAKAQASAFVVDGDNSEWANVPMQTSSDSRIAKWAVVEDGDNYVFYVQQNGGNRWGLPITQTNFQIVYADGSSGNNTGIQFAGMMDSIKNSWYGDIAGTSQAYKMSDENNKYEIEFSIPKSYFAGKDFTLSYCGASISSKDIVNSADVQAPIEEEPVYEGISVDGNFKDWAAIAKKPVDGEALTAVAMIFDGDYVYIYMKENAEGALTHSGSHSNGAFTIYTDLGRDTVFKLNTDSIVGIEGATVKHSNLQYEIAIPASQIKQYKETISFGYFMSNELLIDSVANLQEDGQRDTSTSGIVYDGYYEDWNYYPHHLVQYSTPGNPVSDAEAALFQEDSVLYGHVKTYLNLNNAAFKDITLRFNENDSSEMNFTLVGVDEQGNIIRNPNLRNLEPGTYEYYLWERSSGIDAKNINDPNAPIYGKIKVTIGASSDEMEYQVDLNKVAKDLNLDQSDMKVIQASYINVGHEWVTIAGTSSGPVVGIVLCLAFTGSVILFRRKRVKVA